MKQTLYILLFLMIVACEEAPYPYLIKEKNVTAEAVDSSRLSNYNNINDNTINNEDALDRSLMARSSQINVPNNAIDISSGFKASNAESKTSYYLPAGTALTTDLKFDFETDYYIEGALKVDSAWGTYGSLIILEGGVVSYNTGNITENTVIANYGTINLGPDFSISNQGKLYNLGTLYAEGRTTFGDGYIRSTGPANFDQMIFNTIDNTNLNYFRDCVTANYVEVDQGYYSSVYFEKSLLVDGDIILRQGLMILGDNALIDCEDFTVETSSGRVRGQRQKTAVIDAEKFVIKNSNTINIFSGSLNLHADISNQSGAELQWQSSIMFKEDMYLAGDGCKPSFGDNPDAGPTHTLVHIAELSPAETDLSATSISFDNDLTYIAWHKKGPEYKGWIDVIGTLTTDSTETLAIKASYSTPEMDFNSLYNSTNAGIIVSGGNAAGALVGFIDYTQSKEGSDLSIETIKMNGSSGNYILEKDEQIFAVSGGKNSAIATINAEQKEITETIDLPYLKYIVDFNDDIFVLYDIKSGDAKMKNIVTDEEFSIGNIAPVDGKNACAIDTDGKLYVPMGYNGIKVFQNGQEYASFIHPKQKRSGDMANAIAVDEAFIYIAYGTLGLVILDKTDFRTVAQYNCSKDASCNYILKRNNGLLYVAYGTSGLHILKMEELQ